MMLVSIQLTVDGKPIGQQGGGGRFPPGRRGVPHEASQYPKVRAPGN